MKNILLVFAFALFLPIYVNAQTQSLGFRTGSGQITGVQISYQTMIGELNRLQFELGVRNYQSIGAFQFSAIYQWVQDLPQLGEGFHWHYGAGASLGFIEFDKIVYPREDYSSNLISAVSMVGLEYSLKPKADIPLQIGLDVRPTINFFHKYFDFLDVGIGLSLRWQF